MTPAEELEAARRFGWQLAELATRMRAVMNATEFRAIRYEVLTRVTDAQKANDLLIAELQKER
jgi:hypothetical protein